MSTDQILIKIKEKLPYINCTKSSIIAGMHNHQELFICYGRKSLYGLRKWENEKVNIKGGSIVYFAYEYIMQKNDPVHISEITQYIIQYRPDTNRKSIMSNITGNGKNRFICFKNSFIGISNRYYSETYVVQNNKPRSWEEKFQDLKKFMIMNNRLPLKNIQDVEESHLFHFWRGVFTEFHKGNLESKREKLLRDIGFSFDKKR